MAQKRNRQIRSAASVLAVVLAAASAGPASGKDLSLPDAIGLAVAHSYAVRGARHDSAAARLSYAAEKALLFPGVSVTSSASYRNTVPTLDINMPPLSLQRQIGGKQNYQTDLEVSQTLFTGGRLMNTIRAERENSLAEDAALRAQEMATAYDCRRTYLEAMSSAAAVAGAEASRKRLEIIRMDVESQFQAGAADSVDVLEAELALERGHQAVADREVAYSVALTKLRSLAGLDSPGELVLTETAKPPGAPPEETVGRAIRRPELVRLEHLETAASHAVSIARAGYFPSLVGFATYSVGKPNQDLFHDTWNDFVMVGLRLSWSTSLGGRTVRAVAAAREKARSARSVRNDLVDALEEARDAALERSAHARGTVERTERELALARRRFKLAGDRQKAGTLSLNRLLEAEADLAALDSIYRAALVGYYLAEADYYFAVGSPRIFGGLE
jgi:outer membrane protein